MLGGRWRIEAGNGHLGWGVGGGGLLEGALGAFVLKGSRGAVALDALDVAAVDVPHVFCFFFGGETSPKLADWMVVPHNQCN